MRVAPALGNGCALRGYNDGSKINDAAVNGNFSKTKALLKANPDLVFSKDEYGYTPLHRAAFMGQKHVAQLLLAGGATVNAKDNFGDTPLDEAASMGHKDVAELLLADGGELIEMLVLGSIQFTLLSLLRR